MKSGNFSVTADCKPSSHHLFDENVTANFYYDVVAADNTTILKTGVSTLPNKTLYPIN